MTPNEVKLLKEHRRLLAESLREYVKATESTWVDKDRMPRIQARYDRACAALDRVRKEA